jgi:molybdopterin-guanine dinucleotide biosynthesis protein A
MHGDPKIADASAIILTGGKSSRMGRSKALLPFDGEPLVVHITRMLRVLFDDVVIVAAADQELPHLPATLVRDETAYQGPVAGIYYGLKAARGKIAFATSCDAPFLNPTLIAYLSAQILGYDVVVPYWQDRFQPLHAIYRRNVVAPFLAAQLAEGELRPISVYKKVRTREVGEEEIRRHDPEGLSFLNMNTPADYEDAVKRWRNFSAGTTGALPFSPASLPPGSISCTVELFSVARLRAKTDKVALTLPQDATLSHVFSALAEKLPALVGAVIEADGKRLTGGHACNINGTTFVRDPGAKIRSGDNIFIISADAGG